MELPYDPAIPLLDSYQKKIKYRGLTISTFMVTATLFTIINKWKKFNTRRWMDDKLNVLYHIMEHCGFNKEGNSDIHCNMNSP
jgi:hypothetical protein